MKVWNLKMVKIIMEIYLKGYFLLEVISDGWQTQPMIKLDFKCQMMMAT